MKLNKTNYVKRMVNWSSVAYILTLMMSLTAVFAIASAEDCPRITTKDVLCPGKTEKKCGTFNSTTLLCSPKTFVKVSTGAFSNKPNGTNETNTQTTTDNDDKVTCTQTGACIINILKPSECTSLGVVTVNTEVNPLEEIQCD